MKDIATILTHLVASEQAPSVLYVFFNKEEVLHSFRYGYADIANAKAITEHSTINCYSITKTFTAVAILQLMESGALNVDAPACKYYPNFPYSNDITIRHLMSHTSGLPNPLPLNWIHLPEEHKSFNRNVFFDKVFKQAKQKAKPGERFAYSNLGYVLLGSIIENVSGKCYEDYISANILQPIGVTDDVLGFNINPANHAKGYQKQFSLMNLLLGFMLDKNKYMGTAENGWKPFVPNYVNGTSYGGLIGSTEGLVKYIQALLSDKHPLLKPETQNLMFSENLTTSGKNTGMCLGWYKGELLNKPYYTHAGGGGGYYCEMRIYPEQKLGSVIMFNRTGVSDERFLTKPDSLLLNTLV